MANAALERCKEEGGHECDALAIRRANGAVEEKMSEQAWLEEAVTYKHLIGRYLKDTTDLLGLKTIPKALRVSLEQVRGQLRKTWGQLAAEIEPEPDAEPAAEAVEAEITGDFIQLNEGAVDTEGVVSLKLIRPGWGSSGFYAPDVLERDGPKVFAKGTKMYWDHQTVTEERERPEGTLTRLAGEFITDALWQADGADGPGLYADAKVFAPFRQPVDEMAPHIGVSIRAMGKATNGEAEGRKGPIIAELTLAKSVDFVTVPGAGGKVLQLFESYREGSTITEEPTMEGEPIVTDQEAQELREANEALVTDTATLTAENATLTAENKRLTEVLLLNSVAALVTETLATIEMAPLTRERLTEALKSKPVITDGELDRGATVQVIQEAAQAEIEYLAGVVGSGEIRGMGEPPQTQKPEALRESFKSMWIKTGKSPEEAEHLAEIAAQGR